jgi:hypothetical protein
MTVDCWRVRGPSRHRHGERHREIGLGMRYSRPHDDDDAHDGPLQAYSRQGGTSLLRRALPLQPDPTNPTLGAENPIPMLFSSL